MTSKLCLSLIVLSAMCIPSAAHAQRRGERSSSPVVLNPDYDSSLYSSPAATSSRFKALRWRLVGPFRGGRVDAVAGDPVNRLVFYMGSVNGGVWKTTNGGQTWRNITDGKTDISSVGAIAVAESDANVIYVGTGESQLREDLTYGTGVYRSTDAGASWKHLGLEDTQQIGDVVIDPRNPDRVFVAAIGHAFGPNPTRGVFRSLDGGATWKKVLFLNDSTGAMDLTMDPSNPRILIASMWKFQRTPWGMNAGGGRSGLWKTTDGGDTWREITFNEGIPDKPLGKIGVSISPANPQRVYASIEAPDSAGGIFRSDDAGETWRRMTGDQRFAIRPWYYSAVTADPQDENTVYVMNLQVNRSVDGGRTFTTVRVPHGDTHIMWVDPHDSKRLINGNDGGATVSFDYGATWSSILNQPTAQFYHVTTDNQFPYRLYGAQQDNSAISFASRSDDGSIGERDYFSVAGCENATIAPDPRDPNVTYGGCYTGILTRYDHKIRQERDISVWMINYDGWPASDIPYRFQWTYPVVISPHDPNTLYVTSQFVHKSTDQGASWTKISPDLTVHDAKTLVHSGGPIHYDMTGTEWYATIYAFNESPLTKGLLWAGSDDGLLHVSRDGGGNWQNITPANYGKFTRTAVIEPSHFDAGTAYVAANRYQQDDFRPHLWKTTDYGKTWTEINSGIPKGAYTRTIREDPTRRGLLYAGTETGVYVSFDDGAHWQPLQLNLPRSSVRDLRVHGNDLIAATHGRAFWALDDISMIRQMSDEIAAKPAHLFQPATAIRWVSGGGRSLTAGWNPRGGANFDYNIGRAPTGKVTLLIRDKNGTVVRKFSSASPDTTSPKTNVDSIARAARLAMQDSVVYEAGDSIVPTRLGTNRFNWNLRYEGAKEMPNTLNDEGTLDGPIALPGSYSVSLIVGTDTMTRNFEVGADPRVKTPTSELARQFELVTKVRNRINDIVDNALRTEDIMKQADQRAAMSKDQVYAKRVSDAVKPLRARVDSIRRELYEVHCHANQCSIDQPMKLYNQMLTINSQVQTGDYGPTKQHGEMFTDFSGQVQKQLDKLQQIEQTDLAAVNKLLLEVGLPIIYVPPKNNPAPTI